MLMKSLSRYFTTSVYRDIHRVDRSCRVRGTGIPEDIEGKGVGNKNEDSKQKGKKSKKDDNVDIMDLSLDENLMRPIVRLRSMTKWLPT